MQEHILSQVTHCFGFKFHSEVQGQFLRCSSILEVLQKVLLRFSMASQCCFPYFQCPGSHYTHLIDVLLLLANPVLQNISSHAVMSQNFRFIKISCRFMEFNSEILILQDWLFHLQFTKGSRDTAPPKKHNCTTFYTKQKTRVATAHIIFMECNLPYLQTSYSSRFKEIITNRLETQIVSVCFHSGILSFILRADVLTHMQQCKT